MKRSMIRRSGFRWGIFAMQVMCLVGLLLWGGGTGGRAHAARLHAGDTVSLSQTAGNAVDDLDGLDEVNAGDDDNLKHEGFVVARPAAGLIGEWRILAEDGVEITVLADASTRFDPADAAAYTADVWVEAEGAILPGGSIQATRIRLDDYEDGEIVVRMRSAADLDRLIQAEEFDGDDLAVKSGLLQSAQIYLLSTDDGEPDLVERIRAVADTYGVIWVELNYVHSVPEGDGYKTWGWGGPDEPGGYATQDAYRQVGVLPVLDTFDGESVTVAVLDTGIYSTHEQFAGRLIWPSLDVIDDDLAPDEAGPGLAWGHGTHVAGVVVEMAPQAKILPVRVLDSGGRGNTFLLAYAIEWAVDQGATVINLSLGTASDSQILRDVIADAAEAGVMVVAAAGNAGIEQIQYPAGYDRVLGVTSVTYVPAEARFVKSSFANYGAGWVDLAAPGEGVMSAMIQGAGPGYATWSGTSMAAAFVSGAAALAQQKLRDQAGATAAEVEPVIALLVENGAQIDGAGAVWSGKVGRLLDVDGALLPGTPGPGPSTLFLPALPSTSE